MSQLLLRYILSYFSCQQLRLVSDIKYVWWTFYRHMSCLGVAAVASFRKQMKGKNRILRKHSIIVSFSRACGRWRHVFATTRSANHRWVPKKNVAVSPSSTTVDAGHSYDISRVLVAWLIRAGGNPPITNTARTIYTFWYHILPHEL